MKQYSQMGFGAKNKVETGLTEQTLDGAIFGPKDLNKKQINKKIESILKIKADTDLFIDPQFYAWKSSFCSNKKLGDIDDWNYLKRTTSDSSLQINEIDGIIDSFIDEIQNDFPDLTGIITPNIYISTSLKSNEANLAKEFITKAKNIADKKNEVRQIFPTIAVDYKALLNIQEVKTFLDQICKIENPPAGFYLLVGSQDTNVPPNICNSDVISAWMYINKILASCKYKVINGYSDILSPFLQIAGGYAGSTGWWGNLRCFSMNRFCELQGYQRPSARYLSINLLNRILCSEYSSLTQNNILSKNKLRHDVEYDNNSVSPTIEAAQTWESIAELLKSIGSLKMLKVYIKNAQNNYQAIYATPLKRLYATSRDFHLSVFSQSIDKYESLLNP